MSSSAPSPSSKQEHIDEQIQHLQDRIRFASYDNARAEPSPISRQRLFKTVERHCPSVHNRLFTMNAKRKDATPISRLPNEILCMIFSLYQAVMMERLFTAEWIKVTHVCRRWMQVARAHAHLWSDIHDDIPLDLIGAFIERSKHTPRINLRMKGKFMEWPWALSRVRFTNLIREGHRLRYLEFRATEACNAQEILDNLPSSAPFLETLTLCGVPLSRRPLCVPQSFLDNALTTNLRELRLINCAMPSALPLLEGLFIIHLELLPPTLSSSPRDFLRSLRSIPNVVDLRIKAPPLFSLHLPLLADKDLSSVDARIPFPLLEYLSISLSMGDSGGLLSWLSIPPSTIVLLESVAENAAVDDLVAGFESLWPAPTGIDLDAGPHQWASAEFIHQRLPRGHIMLRAFTTFATFDHFFRQESRAQSRQFSMQFTGCLSDDGIHEVITSIHPLREITSLSLKSALPNNLDDLLDHFESLQYIVIGHAVAKKFIRFLSDDPALLPPTDDIEDNEDRVLSLPDLATIVFNRVGFVGRFTSRGDLCLPVPFNELVAALVRRRKVSDELKCVRFSFCDIDPWMVERMVEELEGVDVYWSEDMHPLAEGFRDEDACDDCGNEECPGDCQEPRNVGPSWN